MPKPPTLLSVLQGFKELNSSESIHPFSSSAPSSVELLNQLVQSTEEVSNSLATHISLPFNPHAKLVSLLRQHANISSAVHLVSKFKSLSFAPLFNLQS